VKSTNQPIQEEGFASKACVWFIGLCGGKTRAAYVYKIFYCFFVLKVARTLLIRFTVVWQSLWGSPRSQSP
jgi:hypothetical protein